jgi:hypothetical protein
MARQTVVPDRTAWIPWILFGIFAAIVGYAIWKGCGGGNKTEQMEEDVLYVKPAAATK